MLFVLICQGFARQIESEGIGYTRDGAVQAALRSAVERCVGLSVNAQTIVENQVTISDKILSNVKGYVSSYSILSERTEFGLVNVRVSAEVSMKKLDDDLAAQRIVYALQNKPRVMVVLDERIEDRTMSEKTATYKFQEQLVAKGFIVVEPEQWETIRKTENIQEQASLAFEQGADLIVRGNVQVATPTPIMLYNTQFYSVPVQINARIVRADNAQIIASRTKRIKKNSRDPQSAAQFGLEIGGEALATELITDLFNFWNSETYNDNRIEMIITGFSAQELGTIEDSLRHCPTVRELRLRFFEGTKAYYDADLRGTVQEIRGRLDLLQRLGLKPAQISSHRIVLQKEGTGPDIAAPPEPQEGVSISAFTIDDIFPSRIGYYESNPAASITIKTQSSSASAIKISMIIPELMTLPAEQKVDRLPLSSEKAFPMSLALNSEKLSSIHEDRTLYGQATLSFMSNNGEKKRTLTTPLKVFDGNAMDWSESDAIGAFVTFRAPHVKSLASQALREIGPQGGENKELLQGLALFEALKTLGLSYIPDPRPTPGKKLLDQVQYPHPTLERLGGDCDDLSVLYASLLSSVGIPTAVISYSDHVLVMFDTRIFQKNRLSFSVDSTATIVNEGTLWIPVETTRLKDGFVAAWLTAAKEFHQAIDEGQAVAIITLEKAWRKYPPAPVPEWKKELPLASLSAAIAAEKAKFKEASLASLEAAVKDIEEKIRSGASNDTAADFNRLGVFSARLNKFKESSAWFKKALQKHETAGIASNNACAMLLSGQEDEALAAFNKIYKSDPTGRIALNRALCLYVSAKKPDDVDASLRAMSDAAAMMPSRRNIGALLGIDLSDGGAAAKGAEIQDTAKRQEIDLRRLKELIRSRVLAPEDSGVAGTSSGTSTGTKMSGTITGTSTGTHAERIKQTAMPFGGIRGADPDQISKVKDLLYWFE
jgi:hypothetical protein